MKIKQIKTIIQVTVVLLLALFIVPMAGAQTIKILGIQQAFLEAFKTMAPAFEEETGIKVEFEMIGFEGLRERQMLEMANPRGNVDIITPYREVVPIYAENQLIMSLDEMILENNVDTSNIFPSVLDAHSYNGQQYSLPVQADSRMFFYRTDIWNEAGLGVPPEDWDELYSSAAKLTGVFDGKTQYGTSINAHRGVWVLVNAAPYLYASGGDFFDEDSMPIFNSQESIDTFTYLKKLLSDTAPTDVMNWIITESLSGLRQGLVASCVMWTGGGTVMRDEPVFEHLSYSLIPTKDGDTERTASGGLGGWGMAIPANAPNKEAAFQFLMWAIDRDNALQNATIGGDSPAQGFIYDILAEMDPSLFWVKETLALATPIAPYPEYPQVEDITSLAMHEALSGAKPVEQALNEANEKLIELMKRAGRL